METETIRITVADSEGVLLDTITVTRDEFAAAQRIPMAAVALLASLQVGA